MCVYASTHPYKCSVVVQEELGTGLRLLDLEQLQLEAQNAATTLSSREADKATLLGARRQAIQVAKCQALELGVLLILLHMSRCRHGRALACRLRTAQVGSMDEA